MTDKQFTRQDIQKIASKARELAEVYDEPLDHLVCPNDGAPLAVYDEFGRRLTPSDAVRGVKHRHDEVTTISVECTKCGAGATKISLRSS
jgi:hypothetical protein